MNRTRALILLCHGSREVTGAGEPARRHAETIRKMNLFDEVLAAFWKEEPHLSRILELTRSDDLFLVPLFTAEGYFTRQAIPRELNISKRITHFGNRRVFYGEPIGTHPAMGRVLKKCAEAAVRDSGHPLPPDDQTTLIILGHGTGRDEKSGDSTFYQVEQLKREETFHEILPAFLEQEPFSRDVLKKVRTPFAIAVPFLISEAPHSQVEIPASMGILQKGQPLKNPVDMGPLRVWYARPIGMADEMVEVILERAKDLI